MEFYERHFPGDFIKKKPDPRRLPPTLRIVRNLTKELSKSDVSMSWVFRFYARHQNKLRSVYLRTINYKRKTVDNVEL